MSKSLTKIASGLSVILHSLIVPIFVLVFTIYYRPQGLCELLTMSNVSYAFNSTIVFCIVLLSVTVTRCWLYFLGKFKRLALSTYILWCVGETVIASLFCSLYLVLISTEVLGFFDVAGALFVKLAAITIYPYAFIWLGIELYSRNNESSKPQDDGSLIRFHDEYKKLRLVIAPEAVIYIKSEDNYVQIHYLDNDRPKKFILRSSMKALEDILSKHGLVRCHRSYYLNPDHVKIVHRDSAGLLVAELKHGENEIIPISRKYQDVVSRLL